MDEEDFESFWIFDGVIFVFVVIVGIFGGYITRVSSFLLLNLE